MGRTESVICDAMVAAMSSDNNLMHDYPSIYVNLLHSLRTPSTYIFYYIL